ncbi:heme ABC exporter ATP-binding protein CcmA [Corynebacterium sp. TAE3-ERU12]|uniref:heme ABC exporter ATP-binding protein CcmA n=1 Tax=Corynebacterium sp. TAE3-ERU12 TaxID=2849491 RepID=UPI001C477FE1|nr:heme ABC exporter ATP-binding protein CcmA [Corynebacterium sp. TAE3-ERU12]MBV7294511.1 heme ABC exporter ATP-binding protein CcmA [Corynebacterium sp. TAE3-ERU12]
MVTTAPVVRAEDLAYSVDDRILWEGLSFTLEPGSFLAVTGPSGCGKTSLLLALGGLVPVHSGEIRFGQRALSRFAAKEKRQHLRHTIGYCFQNAGIVPTWSVRRNFAILGRAAARETEALTTALAAFGLPADLLSRRAGSLSGGERHRVALARLAIQDPAILLLDEPTSALDDANADLLADHVRGHVGTGGSVIAVTHDPRLQDRADDVLRLGG